MSESGIELSCSRFMRGIFDLIFVKNILSHEFQDRGRTESGDVGALRLSCAPSRGPGVLSNMFMMLKIFLSSCSRLQIDWMVRLCNHQVSFGWH